MRVLDKNGIDDYPGGNFNDNEAFLTFDTKKDAQKACEILTRNNIKCDFDKDYDYVIIL